MKRNLMQAMIGAVVLTGLIGAQTKQTLQTEQAREQFGQTMAYADKVVLGVGNIGDHYEEFTPMFAKIYGFLGDRMFVTFINDENKQILADYLRGFLSNTKEFTLAELDNQRLNQIGEEFTLVELGGAEFQEAKETGKWAALDYLVTADLVIGRNGEYMVEARLINVDTREQFKAIVGKEGEKVSNIEMAMRLARNIADVYKAESAEERELLYKIQRQEATCASANLDSKIMMQTIGGFYAGGAVIGTLKGGFSGIFFGTIFSGAGAGVSWWAYRQYAKIYDESRAELEKLINTYNNQYDRQLVMRY